MTKTRRSIVAICIHAALLTAAIPWYWPPGDQREWLGVPLWAVVSLAAIALTAIFTAWQMLHPADPTPSN